MNFQTAVMTCLTQKYAQFKGRASRSEYWWFVLAYVIGAILVALIGIPILSLVYMLALIVPAAAAGFRRLQDMGKPGWYIFIPMGLSLVLSFFAPSAPTVEPGQVPDFSGMGGNLGIIALLSTVQLVLAVIFIWWLTRPSEPGANAYGPPPAE